SMSVLHNLGQSYKLQLVLTIPRGSVELEITPARYQHINEGDPGSRYIIGAQITRISDADRERFVEYLNSLDS
ncbi:MAG: hypothetical protein M3362_16245, partial [Acidobacteriota bacterium]|nr:hypothetical protein [Acidobacteriota bacterium]